MKKALIIIVLLMAIGGGAGYYYWDKEQQRIAHEQAVRDSLQRLQDLENARLAALDKANRDSLARYAATHSPAAIRAAAERLIKEEFLSGRNHVGGDNWTERMNILREQCDNVLVWNGEIADSVFRTFSFKNLMGKDTHVESDSVMRVYYISVDSAWVDVHFNLGEEIPEGQNVIFKLHFIADHWLLDDFVFEYSDGDHVSAASEMHWFVDLFSVSKKDEEEEEETTNNKADKKTDKKIDNKADKKTENKADKKTSDKADKKTDKKTSDKKISDKAVKKTDKKTDKKTSDKTDNKKR